MDTHSQGEGRLEADTQVVGNQAADSQQVGSHRGVARWVKSAIAWRPGVRIVGICRRVAIGTVGRLRSIISALIVSSIRIGCPAMIPQHKESGNKNIHKRHPKLFCCEEKQTKTNGGCSTANCVLPTVGAPCPRVIDTLQ